MSSSTSSLKVRDVNLLYPGVPVEQILLAEQTSCLSVQAFLKMCGLNFEVEMRSNAEHMSPAAGKLPFIKCGQSIVAELEPIVEFVEKRGVSLTQHLNHEQKSDMKAYMSLINVVLHHAELYLNWIHEKTYREITKRRYSSCYPWPLNHVLTWKKRKAVISKLKTYGWASNTVDEVRLTNSFFELINLPLHMVQAMIIMVGRRRQQLLLPTELDALVFGHLFSILTTTLPDVNLSNVVRQFPNLVELCRRIDSAHFQKHSD
ncbi:MTX2 [Cordylochernes scorpioides]|uniref:MTX2 n=1 Tax=Cordylochernes scorpioides TaxID=51811 RepID=A0ABY6KR92_9ARAC|nr:MTX2 [Cordylochernes scorpioides]